MQGTLPRIRQSPLPATTVGNNIFVGDATGDGLNISQTTFNKMQAPNLTIGGAGYNGTITVENVTGALGRLNLIADGAGGAINLSGGVDLDGKDASGISLYIQGSGATTDVNGTTSVAGDMIINDAVRVVGDSKLASTDGNITVTGGTDGIYSANGSNNDLELYAYNGTIIAGNQTGFGDNSGADSLIDMLLMWGENTTIGDGNHAISGLFDTWLYPLMILGTGSTDLSAGGFFTNDIQGNSNNLTFTGSSAYFVGSISDVLDLTYNGNGSDDDVSLTNNVTTTGDQNWNVPVLQLRDNEGDPSENLILTAGGDVTISKLSRNQGFAKSGSILSNLNLTIDAPSGNVAIDGVSFAEDRDVALGNVTISNAVNVSLGGGFSENGTGNGIDGNLIMTGITDTVTLNASSGSSYLIGGELSIDSAHVVVDANITLETAGNLSITATGSTGNSRSGVDVNAAAGGTTTLRALGSSNITLNGTSGDQWSTNAEGVELGDTAGGNVLVETASGDITIVGVAAGNADEGIVVEATTIQTTAGGSITLNGTAGNGNPSNTTDPLNTDNDGISFEGNAIVYAQAGGDISITGVATNRGEGIDLDDETPTSITTSTGDVFLNGTNTGRDDGVQVGGNTLFTVGGNLTIDGTGGGNGTYSGAGTGIKFENSTAAVSGNISFTGNSVDGYGTELVSSQLTSITAGMTFTGNLTGSATNGNSSRAGFLSEGSSLNASQDINVSYDLAHPSATAIRLRSESGTTSTMNSAIGSIALSGTSKGVNHAVDIREQTTLEAGVNLSIAGVYDGPAVHGYGYQYGVAIFSDVTLTAVTENLSITGKTNADDGRGIGFDTNNNLTGNSSVTILADTQEWDYGSTPPAISVQGNGSLEMGPYAGSTDFDSPINLANVDFGTTFTSAKLGVPTATGYDLRVGTQGLRVNGPIEIYGGTPIIDGEIASTAEGQSVLVQGASGIEVGKNISTTNGSLTLNGTTSASDSITLSSGSGDLTVTDALLATTAGTHDLNLNSTGTAKIGGAVGNSTGSATTFFNSLTTNAGGTTEFSGNIVALTQTFNGDIVLNGSMSMGSMGTAAGLTATFNGNVDATNSDIQLGFVSTAIDGANWSNLGSLRFEGTEIAVQNTIQSTGDQTYDSTVNVVDNLTLDTGSGDLNISGPLLATTAGTHDVNINSTGTAKIGGAVGNGTGSATTFFNGLTTNAGGTTEFSGNVVALTQTFNDDIVLNGSMNMSGTTTNAGLSATFNGQVDATNSTIQLGFVSTAIDGANWSNLAGLRFEGTDIGLQNTLQTTGDQTYIATNPVHLGWRYNPGW